MAQSNKYCIKKIAKYTKKYKVLVEAEERVDNALNFMEKIARMQKNTKGLILDFALDMGDGNAHSTQRLKEEKKKLQDQKKHCKLQIAKWQKYKAKIDKKSILSKKENVNSK